MLALDLFYSSSPKIGARDFSDGNIDDPHAEGIVIAEVSGKNNLSRPILVFQALGIWDSVLLDFR